jgi:hypothetical protein
MEQMVRDSQTRISKLTSLSSTAVDEPDVAYHHACRASTCHFRSITGRVCSRQCLLTSC